VREVGFPWKPDFSFFKRLSNSAAMKNHPLNPRLLVRQPGQALITVMF
jgi:hypothetical protein